MADPQPTEADGPPPKGRVPRAQRERQILAMAERVFAKHGFEAASMEEIARECDVDRALVYQYFGSKRVLYDACHAAALTELTQSVSSALEDIAEAEGEAARLEVSRRAVRAFFEFVQQHSDGWDVLFGAGWSTMGLTRRDEHGGPDMLAWVEGVLAMNYPQARPERLAASAAAMLGAGWAISLWWRQTGSMTIDEVTDQHLEFCLAALEPLQSGGAAQPGGPAHPGS